jgi:hypothetical protein
VGFYIIDVVTEKSLCSRGARREEIVWIYLPSRDIVILEPSH